LPDRSARAESIDVAPRFSGSEFESSAVNKRRLHCRRNWLGISQRTGRAAGHSLSLNPITADKPWREGGWTRKEIVGHLLDSAANNRQRFVRAAADGRYDGPKYLQDAWVKAHGYGEQNWEKLVRWWQAEHEILRQWSIAFLRRSLAPSAWWG